MFFLAVLEVKVHWSDPLPAISCTSSRTSAFLLALHPGCDGKGTAASPPSFQGTGVPRAAHIQSLPGLGVRQVSTTLGKSQLLQLLEQECVHGLALI